MKIWVGFRSRIKDHEDIVNESFLQELQQSLGPQVSQQLAANLGMERDQADQAFEKVAPLILGGLKRQAEQGGEDRVNHIVQKYGRENALNDIGDHIQSRAGDSSLDATLGGLLGNAGPQAAGLLDDKLGLTKGMGMKLIPILAPLILGALKKRANAAPAGGGGNAGNSDIGGGLLTSILDRDGDGNMLDDVAGMIFKTSASSVGGGKSGGLGFIAKILSMIFGRR